jgi:hypothetical protein
MPEPFEALRETLLHAGVAPTHVRRYVRELSEHVADIVGEEQEAGRSPAEAAAAARARLGADEALAEAMLAQPSLRSWTGRAPWAMLVALPAALLVLAWIFVSLGVLVLMGWPPDANGAPQPPAWLPQAWLEPAGTALLNLVQVGGPLVIGSGVALLGARQRSRPVWPLLGCLAVACLGASLHWYALWPVAGSPERSLGIGFGEFRWSRSLGMGSFSLAVAVAVYWTARAAPSVRIFR